MVNNLSLLKSILIAKPSITEKEIYYVNDAIRHGWGEKCFDYIKKFEDSFSSYIGVKYSVATSSCTGAIHLALLAMGLKPGDEVILPDITWIASAAPVVYIGAKPVFVDVSPETWCIDPLKIEKAITNKTKVIIVVHLYGNVADLTSIIKIAKKYNIKILEDTAEGLGSEFMGKKVGSLGDVGVFSFHGTKTLSTGEGGMIVTNKPNIYERVKILNHHGTNPKFGKMLWMAELGYKYKISNLQAAMGCAQVERAEELVNKKREIFGQYKELFNDTTKYQLNFEASHTKNGYWMPTVIFDKSLNIDREQLMQFLKKQNIYTRPFFYPLSSLPMFKEKKINKVSYDIYYRGINLPSYYDLISEDINNVFRVVNNFIKNGQGKTK